MDKLCIQIELLIDAVRPQSYTDIRTICDYSALNGHEISGLIHRFKAVRSITVIVHDPLPICQIGQGTVLLHIGAVGILIKKTLGVDIHQRNDGSRFKQAVGSSLDIVIRDAAQVEKLGIGKILDNKSITANGLRDAALAVMEDPQIQESLRKIHGEIACAPGNRGAVRIIEEYFKNNTVEIQNRF